MSDQDKASGLIERTSSPRQRKEATPAEVLELFVEELAQELRQQWKQELDEELRERAERALLRQ